MGAQYPPHIGEGHRSGLQSTADPWGNSVLLAEGVVLTVFLPRNPPHCPSCWSQLASAQGSSQVSRGMPHSALD